jgi:exodeoxyribonuclease-3
MSKRKADDSSTLLPIKKPKVSNNTMGQTLKICTWNVCGLRSMLRKGTFIDFLHDEQPDILCLNETMMTPEGLAQIESQLPNTYFKYWNHSIRRLGYSGTSVWSKIEPISVQFGLGIDKHDNEGRLIVAEYENFYIVCNYVPNSGDQCWRLEYRTTEWDTDMREYVSKLQKLKPVIWLGDMNVVHEEIDIWKLKGKEKCACCTPQERSSFSRHLEENDLIDTWRHLHPGVQGWSYYSRRNVRAKEKNRGWRLDYILVSRVLEKNIKDAYMRDEVLGSDHHPVMLNLSFET